ncbi:MAG: hypothetical protein M1818_006128 [Claussenomyces sp. TS43310]|nr:MAG: hypothetical protein M1818_006128 [Claussenomyces sp. TS43310]
MLIMANARQASTNSTPSPYVTSTIFKTPNGNGKGVVPFKATVKRPAVSGGFGDPDVYGSEQHIPLMNLVQPIPRISVNA